MKAYAQRVVRCAADAAMREEDSFRLERVNFDSPAVEVCEEQTLDLLSSAYATSMASMCCDSLLVALQGP